MKKIWIAVNLFGILLIACVWLCSCTNNYYAIPEVKEVLRVDTVVDTKKVVKLEKKVKQLKRKLKKVTWVQDSLKAEEIRKDGIISYFPKQEIDGVTYIEIQPNEYLKIK